MPVASTMLWTAAWTSAVVAVLYAGLLSPSPPAFPPPAGTVLPSNYAVCSARRSGVSLPSLFTFSAAARTERRIHTLAAADGGDDDPGSVECIVVRDGRIAAHTTPADLETACAAEHGCQRFNLPRRAALLPGLHDAHGHVLDLGWSRTAADLVGSKSVAEVIQRLEAYVLASEAHRIDQDKWVEGLGWDQSKFDPPVFPTAHDFDRSDILRNRNIALRRIDVHALWTSARALRSITALPNFPRPGVDVPGGLVVRDPKTQEPTGILVDNAMNFAYEVIPKVDDAQRHTQLQSAAQAILSVGLTNVGDAAVDLESIEFLRKTADRGHLPFRLYAFIACPPSKPRCDPPPRLVRHAGRLTVRTVKLFADGALGSWGSAMLEPYTDRPEERGLLLIPEHEIEPLIRTWVERGWQVATHAIGDRANKLVLDAYETIHRDEKYSGKDLRLRVEHAQIMRHEDIPRFAQLGVIASMQPTHCTSDMGYVETRLGHARAKAGAYVWNSLLHTNATLAFGSDFPVEEANPFHGIYSAITRLDPKGNSPQGREGWFPEQRLTRMQALRAFTTHAAYAQFEEAGKGGTLAVGALADFVVVDRDILDEREVSAADLRRSVVFATVIDGQIAWQRS